MLQNSLINNKFIGEVSLIIKVVITHLLLVYIESLLYSEKCNYKSFSLVAMEMESITLVNQPCKMLKPSKIGRNSGKES